MNWLRGVPLAILAAPCALAHEGEPLAPDDLWTAWRLETGIIIPLALILVLYVRGARASRGIRMHQLNCFWSGYAALVLALMSPLHPMGEALFSAHMVQHEILMLIAAPLIVCSRPLVPLLWGLPLSMRRRLGRFPKWPPVQKTWSTLTRPLIAWWVHAAALWIWHAPGLFQLTLVNETVHAAQHLSFLGSALLFWWSLFYVRGQTGYGAGVLYIFTTAVHTSILGALLTFSTRIWFPAYARSARAWGLTPLEDQQIGGLIMWVPAGIIYVAVALFLFAAWLRESDTRTAETRYVE